MGELQCTVYDHFWENACRDGDGRQIMFFLFLPFGCEGAAIIYVKFKILVTLHHVHVLCKFI